MSLTAPIRLDPALQPAAWRPVFNQFGRLHVPGILTPDDAAVLSRGLASATGWRRSIHVNVGQDIDIPVEEIEELSPDDRAAFDRALHSGASDAFQYVFDSIRVSHEIRAGRPVAPMLAAAYRFMNSEPFLAFVRALTGEPRAAYCDMMATRYLPGHFLTAHDDHAPGKHRLFAYVLNLTPRWRADWGGILLFLDDQDHVAEGYAPALNALNIFRVPQRHAVSLVAPFAVGPRLSLTGWIRARPPEDGGD